MTDNEASIIVYYAFSALRAPQKIDEFRSMVVKPHRTSEFTNVIDGMNRLIREAGPERTDFRQRIDQLCSDTLPLSDFRRLRSGTEPFFNQWAKRTLRGAL